MTVSEFESLRADLHALGRDMEARFFDQEKRMIRVEAKLDDKPSATTIYQAALAVFAAMFAVVGVTVLKGIGIIP